MRIMNPVKFMNIHLETYWKGNHSFTENPFTKRHNKIVLFIIASIIYLHYKNYLFIYSRVP